MDEYPPRYFWRSPTSDELALGYARGEDEDGELYQLKGVPQEARNAHFYVVGASRTGKTKLLEYMILQDIKRGAGFAVIDPHGDLIENVKEYIVGFGADNLSERVVLIDPTDENCSVCFNPLELAGRVKPSELADELTLIFKKIWGEDAVKARSEEVLLHTLIALIENNLTLGEFALLLDVNRPEVRERLTRNIRNIECRQFFEKFETWDKKEKLLNTAPILNKVSRLLADERVRDILVSAKSSFNLREIMDEGRILLVKLDKGRLKGSSELLGSLILSKIQMAAFARTDERQSGRKQFYLYIDEFQNFAEESFKNVLGESAKYKLSLILAHQNLAQLPPELRASILTNCNLQAYFRVARLDAELLAKEAFAGVFEEPPRWEQYFAQIQTLPSRTCIVRNASEGGIVIVRVPALPVVWEELKITESEFQIRVEKAEIGERYLRRRSDIEAEHRERRKTLLAESREPEEFFRER